MKQLLIGTLVFVLLQNVALASTSYYKMNHYNSKGQKTGYTKVYYSQDKSNVKKVEKYNTKGKRTELYK